MTCLASLRLADADGIANAIEYVQWSKRLGATRISIRYGFLKELIFSIIFFL